MNGDKAVESYKRSLTGKSKMIVLRKSRAVEGNTTPPRDTEWIDTNLNVLQDPFFPRCKCN